MDVAAPSESAAFAAAVANDSKRPLVGSHPVYQYLARRYSLNLLSVHWEPDELPSEQAMRELRELLETHPAKWMLWEGEPLAETVRALAELGIESVVFDPCGNVPDAGDYLSVMRRNAANLARAFGE